MIILNSNSTCSCGNADIICILKLPTGTYHVAFYEEVPMPGPIKPISELDFVRLKSKMHHTQGAATIDGAREHAKMLRENLIISDANVYLDEAIEIEDPISHFFVPNWTTGKITLGEALKH